MIHDKYLYRMLYHRDKAYFDRHAHQQGGRARSLRRTRARHAAAITEGPGSRAREPGPPAVLHAGRRAEHLIFSRKRRAFLVPASGPARPSLLPSPAVTHIIPPGTYQ
ncbi:hypothetical protein DESPIGER_2144 [Desulfovibrio piger]|uniref:Uncharacterized protein n=1 Tax=Desulfovibrio piger TaxID=901 RepID=A0A1K1LKF6_9BACT|nr:hypothetical protein DESPIGER_2144 [Desulfovibrio piger]